MLPLMTCSDDAGQLILVEVLMPSESYCVNVSLAAPDRVDAHYRTRPSTRTSMLQQNWVHSRRQSRSIAARCELYAFSSAPIASKRARRTWTLIVRALDHITVAWRDRGV